MQTRRAAGIAENSGNAVSSSGSQLRPLRWLPELAGRWRSLALAGAHTVTLANLRQRSHAPRMATRHINLTPALDRFVAVQVESGQYADENEVVRAGLKLLEAYESHRASKLAALNAAIEEALQSMARGEGVEVDDIDAYFDHLMQEVEAEVAAEEKAAARSAAE